VGGVVKGFEGFDDGFTVDEVIGFRQVCLEKVGFKVVVDAVEESVTDVKHCRGDVAVMEESTLVGGYMGGCKFPELGGEKLSDEAVDGGGDRDGAEREGGDISLLFWDEVEVCFWERWGGERRGGYGVICKGEIQVGKEGESYGVEKEGYAIRTRGRGVGRNEDFPKFRWVNVGGLRGRGEEVIRAW
jgi:hypothetical protein